MENSGENISHLMERERLLSKLCLDLNPYQEISEEQTELLKHFKISDSLDPFSMTNKLLVLLDETQEALKEYNATKKEKEFSQEIKKYQ